DAAAIEASSKAAKDQGEAGAEVLSPEGRLIQQKMSGLAVRDREAEALSSLPRPPSNGFLGGDPSAGSPTDTLFTFSPCRHGAWTVSSSGAPCAGARRAVSEGSDLSIGLPCGLSAPAHFYIHANRICIAGSSEFPAYSQVCSGSLRIRSRNTVYDLALLAEPRF